MPKPARSGQRYLPGLDGLRALAVLAVIAYHEQLGWALGGLLGVGVFFTLSGYLITSLLLSQWSAGGRLQLKDFWLSRGRRLLPALFVMLAVVTAWVTLLDRARLAGLRTAVAGAVTYTSNWYLISSRQSYFARFAPPAPLDHLWSLAVEEQFYLIWPALLLLGLLCVRKRRPGAVTWLALPTLALAAASAVLMLRLYQPGLDPTRVYEGTDTRAFGLLVGAALAMACAGRAGRRLREQPRRLTRLLADGAGVAGLAVIGLMIWRVGQYSPFAYRGGMVALSAASAAVVAAAACPGSRVGLALGWAPLRWIGARSYGIYLWHYPIIVLTTPANTGEDLPRAAAQVAASVLLAALSWRFIEEPVRHGALGRLRTRVRPADWRLRPAEAGSTARRGRAAGPGGTVRLRSMAGLGRIAAVAGGAAVLVVAAAGLVSPGPAPGGNSPYLAAGSALPLTSKSVITNSAAGQSPRGQAAGRPGAARPGAARPAAKTGPQFAAVTPSASPGTPGGPPLRTSCRAVAHIGDSTSDGLVSAAYLPNPADRIPARYEDVGVQSVRTDIQGARSVVEVLPGEVNGYDAARALVREGFQGCWVIALGTDDTADVAAGSLVSLMTRIQRMMSAAHGEPVMWVNVKSLLVSGPYAESSMLRWNRALVQACARYPNMRIYDWASVVKARWFISDGIHYTSAGYAARAKMIADALARAFPQSGNSSGCVVG
ncbi:MAG TPA: acyltransferase family protein [Streptosporangiaceae bacterium]|jgi:peptidoglycan/LPS O-acetylase OafA/YrhL